MSKNHYGPEYEKQWKNRERLQSEVLKHLKKYGPMYYEVLCVSFETHGTASIQPVLTDLVTYGLIAIDTEKMITITDAGLQTLADQD